MIAAAFLLAYLLGAIPFGLLVARSRGIDLRKVGSGNIGATNAMRAVGRPLGILVFLLDAAKGFLPAWAFLHGWGGLPHDTAWALAAGAAAVVGHTFPVWLALNWPAVLVSVAVFALALAATRYVALASVASAFSLPLALKGLGARPEWLIVAAAAMASLIAIRHRGNFVRMAAGVEPKTGGGRP